MKFILPIVITVAIIAFIGGITLKNFFVAPYNLVLDVDSLKNESSGSSDISTDSAKAPQLSGEAAPATSTHTQNGNTYTSSNTDDKVTMSGDFNLSSYKLKFTFTLPKKGGDITGSVSGACEGTVTGKADAPNPEGFARLEGSYSGDCKPIPTLGFKTKASGTFEGKADYNKGKAGITYENKQPFENRGYFELSF